MRQANANFDRVGWEPTYKQRRGGWEGGGEATRRAAPTIAEGRKQIKTFPNMTAHEKCARKKKHEKLYDSTKLNLNN